MNAPDVTRRDFLRKLGVGTAATVGAGYGLSVWGWGGEPVGAAMRAGELEADAKGRTLVVVEMGGGNDGLNTVVPLTDGRYRDLRPTLAVTDAIELDGEVGLHPSLAKLAKRYGDGQVAIVQGLGYDEPDLSHFGSFAIWWSAKGGTGGGGWLGAYLDGTVGFDDPLAAIAIGPGPSPALIGRQSFATTIANSDGLQPRVPAWLDAPNGPDADVLVAAWSDFTPAKVDTSSLVGQVQRAVGLTIKARTQLDQALTEAPMEEPDASAPRAGRRNTRYQDESVADALLLAAQLVQSAARPRVIYVHGIGDFDTHEGQAERHPALLQQLDEGIDGFFAALATDAKGGADKVTLMTVSEFGRRPAENGSGTDHGTAGAHFVVGSRVRGGRYGEPPSLTHLDPNGNLRHTDDFRRHYATGLTWLGVRDTAAVLGEDFKPFSLFK